MNRLVLLSYISPCHYYRPWQTIHFILSFCRCILDCHIDFLGARDIPPRLKSNLEDIKKEEQTSIFICKCDVCKKYFSNKFKFEIHDCGNKPVRGYFASSVIPTGVWHEMFLVFAVVVGDCKNMFPLKIVSAIVNSNTGFSSNFFVIRKCA